MNISCPDCNAVYEVDFPDLSEDGEMDVKCAKCQCVFPVQGETGLSSGDGSVGSVTEGNEAGSMEGDEADTESQAKIASENMDGLQSPGLRQDGELDDFIDNLIQNEISDDAQFAENLEGSASIQDGEPMAPDNVNTAFTGISVRPGADDAFDLQYEDEDGGFDEFDLKPKKKKFGPFTLPAGKSGSMAIAGIFMGLLMLAGSAYFVMQTFAPPELAGIKKPASAIPEGLTPRDNPDDNIFSSVSEEPVIPASPGDATGDGPIQGKKAGLAEGLAKSNMPGKSGGVSQIEDNLETNANRSAALGPAETMVTMSAILPVAYDANDIKILSFTLQLGLTDQNTARRMRETLPVYENIMVATVETLMSKHFFNDIIYVKEKLRKQFMSDFNKSLQGGRVKTARFREFLIQ